ncbi:hypothetical protein [Cohnella sp. AR92]|uniref:hypothetical protein n=1 Tax=Cohnella sp. AR92 TaxID=648716 RepID=UPI000F8EA367|nr:hypothetical protein [Cohnella sp. AR92]RUS46711.1 hypothetical protein ELR57_13500 [Cohnella sp. AR92]
MIGLTVILLCVAALIWKTLLPMLRRGEFRDGVVFSVMLAGGAFFSFFAANLIPFPAPLHLLVAVYKPFSQWLFSAMGWKS